MADDQNHQFTLNRGNGNREHPSCPEEFNHQSKPELDLFQDILITCHTWK